jgi:hypothetical protein
MLMLGPIPMPDSHVSPSASPRDKPESLKSLVAKYKTLGWPVTCQNNQCKDVEVMSNGNGKAVCRYASELLGVHK